MSTEHFSDLLWVHEAVMVQVLVVNGEASHSSHLGVAGLVEVLTHHEHWIIHDVGGALGHRIYTDDVNDVYDGLRETKDKTYSDMFNPSDRISADTSHDVSICKIVATILPTRQTLTTWKHLI